MQDDRQVVLVGNPNTGKSTLFNMLTGLNQKVGNFPGVTVEKKAGFCQLSDHSRIQIVDLPGIYSLYPKSEDERIVVETLLDKQRSSYPDLIIFVADASNLKRNLLLYTQVADLKIPIIVVLNMMDLVKKSGIEIAIDNLSSKLGVQIVAFSARHQEGIDRLKQAIQHTHASVQNDTIQVKELVPGFLDQIAEKMQIKEPYVALQIVHQYRQLSFLSPVEKNGIQEITQAFSFHSQKIQVTEIIARYNFINDVLFDTITVREGARQETWSNQIDKILTHRVWGFVIFFAMLCLIFQSIFVWAAYPMDLIEQLFIWLGSTGRHLFPEGIIADLLIDGVLACLSGVLVFIPQIAILFAFIAVLEDTGYMSRVAFMMDKMMRKVGLNGKSVVPLIGGLACAVPSIMSTRTIENWKDRMITIMVTPLVSCSARLPVYTLLIALAVPNQQIFGWMNMQGLALMVMYALSIVSAIGVAFIMKQLIRSREPDYFIMELPVYRMPQWYHVFLRMYQQVRLFVFDAGKIIISVSIILWVLASYGPAERQKKAAKVYESSSYTQKYSTEKINRLKASSKLENSYIGIFGRAIEPVIKPLGFDWKIGVALITSFVAREVFVGTMATIYSVDADESNIKSVQEKMRSAKNPTTGLPVFSMAVAFSLMIFYAFAMQCVSTLAVVYRETKHWKWPVIQFVYMTGMAYIASFMVYQLLK